MAVSSSTSATGKGIDVPTIVAGLMEVERAPVTKIESQIAEKTVHISSLGAFKSKVAAFQAAVKVLESPANFASKTSSTTNAEQVTATATGAAAAGVYTVKVAQTAAAKVVAIDSETSSVFTSAALSTSPNVTVDLANLSITQGETTFDTASLNFSSTTTFVSGDIVKFTVNGGAEQSFTIPVTTSVNASFVADAINLAVSTGSLKDISATVSSATSELIVSSANPLKGIASASYYSGTSASMDYTVAVHASTLPADFSISNFISQFNDLNTSLQAKLINTSEDSYRLVMMSTETGSDYDLSVSNFQLTGSGSFSTTVQTLVAARDAVIEVNGVAVSRSSNEISDVVSGVTFNLIGPVIGSYDPSVETGYASFASTVATLVSGSLATTTTISIRNDTSDLTTAAVTNLVSTYNDLISFYNTETKKNASDETLRGTLHNDPAVRSFMLQIKDYLARGVTLADGTSISFASIGVNFMRDGTLSLDASDSITGISLASAIANGLQTKLASGVSIGYQSETANLSNFIKSALRETAGLEGVLAKRINEVENQQEKLQDRKEEIQSRLLLVEARYYRQYAALDALLFKLNTINNALTSAIEGLVNSQKGD